MANFSALAHITIDCTLEQGKQIHKALSFVEDNLRDFLRPITRADLTEQAQTPNWSDLALNLVPRLSIALMEAENDDLSFEYELALPRVQGRQVMEANQFKGLRLFGETVEDDLFDITRVILDALESDQIISTGIAYSSDKPSDEAYGGNYVVITRNGWETCMSGLDRSALEQSLADRAGYWLARYNSEIIAHPHTFVVVTPDMYEQAQVAESVIEHRQGTGLPETLTIKDLHLMPISASTFRELKDALFVHYLNPNSTVMSEAAA